jgi:hypothetical protein
MRGIVWDGKALHVSDELEVRDPGPGEVRERVIASGICHRGPPAGVIDMLGRDVRGHQVVKRPRFLPCTIAAIRFSRCRYDRTWNARHEC